MDWLKKRKTGQLAHLLTSTPGKANCLWALSSSDEGVIRNGGRRGSAFAPQAIQAVYFKFAKRSEKWRYCLLEVASREEEAQNFLQSQEIETAKIQKIHQQFPEIPLVHLGGGHDHIYPFAKALLETSPEKKFHIINIDAHLDTRDDGENHSGTPFRQLAQHYSHRLRISQVGIHPFANTDSSYKGIESMEIYSRSALPATFAGTFKWAQKYLQKRDKLEVQVLSLDCDALEAQVMEAVSAVNPCGLSWDHVSALFSFYRDHNRWQDWAIGIYEMNPIYDNLSQKGAKIIASLLYQVFYE